MNIGDFYLGDFLFGVRGPTRIIRITDIIYNEKRDMNRIVYDVITIGQVGTTSETEFNKRYKLLPENIQKLLKDDLEKGN